jgi:tetratricopeptide (TPR) repeat protein
MERARTRTLVFRHLLWPAVTTYLPMVLFAVAAFLVVRGVVDDGEAALPSATPPIAPADHAQVRDEDIRFFETRVLETRDSLSYNRLVSLYLQRYRETGDVSDIGRAETAAINANEAAKGNYGSIISLALVRLVQHDFTGAETLAREAIAARPALADGHAILGDALYALGRYGEAGDAYQFVLEEAPGPAAYARQASFAEVRGKHDVAEQFWRAAIGAESERPENAAWAMVQLGHLLFNLGDLDGAEEQYEAALTSFPGYPHAAAGLAQVAASRGDLDSAIELSTAAVQAAPQPGYVAALGDALAASGRQEEADAQYALVAAIRQLSEANGIDDDSAIVQFEIDHGPVDAGLVDRARRIYEARPSIEAADTLAWALYRSGDFAAASEAMADALQYGATTPLLAFHAAAIALVSGDEPGARAYFATLQSLNRDFSPLYRAEIAALADALEGAAR